MVSHSVSCFPSKPTGRNCSETARARQGGTTCWHVQCPHQMLCPLGQGLYTTPGPLWGGAEIPRSVPDCLRADSVQFEAGLPLPAWAQRFAPGSLIVYQLRTHQQVDRV